MPTKLTTQEQVISPNEEVLPEESLTVERPDVLEARLPQRNDFAYINDEWSSLTKDLIDTLPRVWTRGLLYFLALFAVIVIPWAMLSKVDEVGSARGRLEPKGSTQKLDSFVTGTVTSVKVKEGQTVKAGQILLEIESDVLRTDLQQAQSKLESGQNRLSQLQLLKNQLMFAVNVQEQQNKAQESEKTAQVSQAQQNLNLKQTSYSLQKLEKIAQVDRARQAFYASQKAYNLSDIRFTKDQAEVQRYQKIFQQGVVPEIKVIELEKVAEESERLRAQAAADVKQAELTLKEQDSSYQNLLTQTESEIKQAKLQLEEQGGSYQNVLETGKLAMIKSDQQLKDVQTQITSLVAEISQNKSQIQALNFQLEQRVLRSPVDGTLFHLPIQRPGAVVQPGQTIAEISPEGSVLIFKALMPTSDSGFLRNEMAVKLKFDAYPFQDYGVIPGHVRWISPDTKVVDTTLGKSEVFELDIVLDTTDIQSQNKRIKLTAGQTATAEVIIRQRRIIDFILDPFKKLQKGGLQL